MGVQEVFVMVKCGYGRCVYGEILNAVYSNGPSLYTTLIKMCV